MQDSVQRWDDDRGGLRREFGAGPATEEPREAERPARERERERERVISVLTQWGATLVIQLRERESCHRCRSKPGAIMLGMSFLLSSVDGEVS